MEQWVRDNFEVNENDNVYWTAVNGKKTSCNMSVILNKFEGLNITYEDFKSVVPAPIEEPKENGVNWGNHVEKWNNQGKF